MGILASCAGAAPITSAPHNARVRTLASSHRCASDQAPADDAVAIRHAFAALPTDQRFAAQLFFVEGLTLAEIAQVQGIPLGTAKTRLFHARRKLKAALSGDDP